MKFMLLSTLLVFDLGAEISTTLICLAS